ncbi:MAG: hypothetical protein ACREFY_07485 [Acetobacteraceae bacterium]
MAASGFFQGPDSERTISKSRPDDPWSVGTVWSKMRKVELRARLKFKPGHSLSMSELDHRIALITGGSRGIGRASALAFAAASADIASATSTTACVPR